MNVISLRRDFHKHPEVGFTEFRTASKVVEMLEAFGYEVVYGADALDPDSRRGVPSPQVLEEAYQRALRDGANPVIAKKMQGGNTAVVATLRGRADGPTVAFRFDMDALPILESKEGGHLPHECEFGSVYDGNMHACAHDAHTAIGLELAERLAAGSGVASGTGDFSGTLKLIFQPSEEGGRGAYPMVKKGVVNDVDLLFCLHLGCDVPMGEIIGATIDFLASTKLAAHFYGVPSHAGIAPEKGRNALLGAASALMNIHALPRFGTSSTRINVGVLEGGTASNIIPQYAKMIVETRAVDADVNKDLEGRVRSIIEHSAAMYGLEYRIEVIGESSTADCDQELVDLVLEEARHVDGFHSFRPSRALGGGEDATFLMRRVQELGGKATYMMIGTPIAAPHHHHQFDICEDVLPMAVELLERVARRTLV